MPTTVADHVLQRLREWGVEQVFGYAGDGINGLLAAWEARRRPARGSSRPGTRRWPPSPPAATPSSAGRVGRLRRHQRARRRSTCSTASTTPSSTTCRVVAIVGQTARSAMGGAYQQEVDLLSLYKDVASDYLQMVTVPEQLPNVLDRAHPDRRQPSAP